MENSSRFFKNTACAFFPCHTDLNSADFNCLFCYCPLYSRSVCPGNPTFIKKEDGRIIKRCTDCIFPHKPENYDRIMSLLKTQKPNIDFEEYHHGGEIFDCTQVANILDFSVNINPLGISERVKNVMERSLNQLERYPDQNCSDLIKKIADFRGLYSENIICGNGASELISLISAAVSPKNALIVGPTFSGYERALKNCYSKIHYHILKKENDFALDETIFDSIDCGSLPDMIFICSPNNPNGRQVDLAILKKLIEFCEEKGIFLFVDECFIDFCENYSDSAVQFIVKSPHLIVLNAFTKIYAMPGIRLGYAMTSNTALLQRVKNLMPEWNVSVLAQIAGIAALEESDYLLKTRLLIKEERDYLSSELNALGFKVYPSDANFILLGTSSEKSSVLGEFLLKKGILLRNCGNFIGLSENFYRVAIRSHQENQRLIDTIKTIQ